MWPALLAGAGGCYLLKLAGLSLPRRLLDHPVMQRSAVFFPVALLAALAAIQTITEGKHLALDARLPGVATAGVLAWVRAPFLLLIAAAAAVTALVRGMGWLP